MNAPMKTLQVAVAGVRRDLDRIAAIADDKERAAAVAAWLRAVQSLVTDALNCRRDAIEGLLAKGWSKHDVAEVTGLSRSMMTRYGKKKPKGKKPR